MIRPTLSSLPPGVAWLHCLLLLVAGFALCTVTFAADAPGEAHSLETLDDLTPEARYRQLSLMLLVSAGVDDALQSGLDPVLRESTSPLSPDEVTTPLVRIVDQATLLAGAAQLFQFTRDNEDALRERLGQLEAEAPEAVAENDMTALSEDTIIIRTAIADAMVYGGLGEVGPELARRYRQHTVVLRNSLEYVEFKAELDALTDQAIASTSGRLDAYQRMFDDETNTGTFDRRIRSAELIYLPEGQFDPRAGELTEEMMRSMILLESEPNR